MPDAKPKPPAKPALPQSARRDKPLCADAINALKEAEDRRAGERAAAMERPKELGGPKGAEPTRYGDWERKGLISDF